MRTRPQACCLGMDLRASRGSISRESELLFHLLVFDEQMKCNLTTAGDNPETGAEKMKAERKKQAAVAKRQRNAYGSKGGA